MSWTPYAKTALLKMLFQNTKPDWEGPSWAWAATMKVSALGSAAAETDNAAAIDGKAPSTYTGYASPSVSRSSSGWSISGPLTANVSAYPTAAITFGKKTDAGTSSIAGIAIELINGGTDYPWIYGTNSASVDQNETLTISANTTSLEIKEV